MRMPSLVPCTARRGAVTALLATIAAALQPALAAPAPAQARAHQEDGAGLAGLPAKPPAAAATAGSPTHVSREGGLERRLWIDSGRVAEFGGDGPPAIRAAATGEVDAIRRGVARPDAAASTAKDQPQAAAGTPDAGAKPVSPVFRDASGRPRALPGGVIVSFRQSLSADEAQDALEAAGLTPLRQIGERMWLVDSPAGMASLELANRLHDEGRFGFAQPNWWQPKATK